MTAKPTSAPRTEPPERSSFSRAITEHAPLPMATVEGVMIQVTEGAQFHEKAVAMNEALMVGSRPPICEDGIVRALDQLAVMPFGVSTIGWEDYMVM